MKFNQKSKLVSLKSKKATAATTTKSVSKSSIATSTLPPAPPPLIPLANLAADTKSGGSGQTQRTEVAAPENTASSAASVASNSCLSALLTSQVGETHVKVQSAGGGQDKSIGTDPGTEGAVMGQRSLQPAAIGHSSSVSSSSSSSESECEDEETNTTAMLGVEGAEAKSKGIMWSNILSLPMFNKTKNQPDSITVYMQAAGEK